MSLGRLPTKADLTDVERAKAASELAIRTVIVVAVGVGLSLVTLVIVLLLKLDSQGSDIKAIVEDNNQQSRDAASAAKDAKSAAAEASAVNDTIAACLTPHTPCWKAGKQHDQEQFGKITEYVTWVAECADRPGYQDSRELNACVLGKIESIVGEGGEGSAP